MNSATPGTLISYRFSPASCCISSCPTISPPVTTCPFNVNLSPFSQAPHSYRVFCNPPISPNSRLSKKQFPFFTWLIVILQPFIVWQPGGSALGWEEQRCWVEADVQMSPSLTTLPRTERSGTMWPGKRDPQPSLDLEQAKVSWRLQKAASHTSHLLILEKWPTATKNSMYNWAIGSILPAVTQSYLIQMPLLVERATSGADVSTMGLHCAG